MRIAVVIEDPPPFSERAGALRFVRFAEAFVDRGHEVTVYATGWWNGYERRREHDGVVYEAVTVSPARTSFLARIPALLARDRPDVVLVSPSPPAAVTSARLGASLAGSPLVCDWFGDEPGGPPTSAVAKLPTRLVTASELYRTRARELGAAETRTSVVPESIDFSLVESTARGEPTDVVYARRLDDDANLESLLLALAELRRRDDWTATVIGDGPERASYERQARDLGLEARVEFVGDLDRSGRVAVYKGAHAFVQTARRERFATELLWALAAGCVGVVEYQNDSSAHELVERREREIRVTDSESLDEALVDAWSYGFSDLDDSFRSFDHAAVAGDYIELFRGCGVDAP